MQQLESVVTKRSAVAVLTDYEIQSHSRSVVTPESAEVLLPDLYPCPETSTNCGVDSTVVLPDATEASISDQVSTHS